jgi:hypothetical protein
MPVNNPFRGDKEGNGQKLPSVEKFVSPSHYDLALIYHIAYL